MHRSQRSESRPAGACVRPDEDQAREASFELFAQKYRLGQLLTVAQRYAACRGLPDSCVEEMIYEALWRVWDKRWPELHYATDDERLRCVYTFMHFVAREMYAAQSRRPIPVCPTRIPDATAEARMDEGILARTALAKIGEALAVMSPHDEAIVELTAWTDMTSSEIGAELSLSQTAVTTRLSRARARLRMELGPELLSELGIGGRRRPGGEG